MKRTAFLCLVAFISIFLFGCQTENEAAEAREVARESATSESEGVLIEGDIAKVELSEKKGMAPATYGEQVELDIFKEVFSNAVRQPGIVNMSAPEYFIKVVLEDGSEEYLNLWLGDEGEQSSLMNADDTHTIYSVTTEMSAKLMDLVEE